MLRIVIIFTFAALTAGCYVHHVGGYINFSYFENLHEERNSWNVKKFMT